MQRLFPTRIAGYLDPFVLLDDFSVEPPAGFPMHPHRGFEAFTYMIDGSFEHKDTMGNESVVSSGGTQRFTSGRGARHSEMPAEGRPNRGMQLWVNLPRRLKTMDPTYEAVHGRDLPEDHRAGTTIRTVVGAGSPVQLQTDVSYRDLTMAAKSRWEDAVADGHQGLLYVAEGHVRVGDVELARGEVALPKSGEIGLVALADARVFLVSGRPHGEPIRHHGPFVD